MSMLNARRQKSAQAERAGEAHGAAGCELVSDEAGNPRRDIENTGPGLLQAVLARENLQRAGKRGKAGKSAAGIDGQEIEQTRRRPITGEWPSLWLDATYLKVRQAGRVVSVATIIACAVNTDGRREILGLGIGESEAKEFWLAFLRGLRQRGLAGVKLVI